MANRGQLAVIHIAKKELGLSDADYRQILAGFDGATSSKQLTSGEVEELIGIFERMGYQPKKRKSRTNIPVTRYRTGYATPRQVAKMKALWLNNPNVRNRDLTGLDSYLKRLFKIDRVEWVPFKLVSGVIKSIEAL